ncbi:PP-loop family-domain-containing protein [Mycena floridula]|nr:PP-loop family-domain-containing protein [Mycena floridula]
MNSPKHFNDVKPPGGWRPNIAVASSGGPDSTCLVYLLNKYIQQDGQSEIKKLTSITVDHGLQQSSAEMARHVERTSASMGIHHITRTAPWDEQWLRRPGPGETGIEGKARVVRYQQLLDAMLKSDINAIALAHHRDDQVETALIRLAKGSKEYGVSGMKPIRRWGMGINTYGPVGFSGYPGMNRWMIRPLLSFSKDRILATCEENRLKYVVDTTNFQPDLTLRNAIRHKFKVHGAFRVNAIGETSDVETYGEDITRAFGKIQQGLQRFQSVQMQSNSSYDYIRSAISYLNSRLEDIETEVDTIINQRTLPSPPSTYLISHQSLVQIADQDIREALINRILRYISFFAWGSLRANANRKTIHIDVIRQHLFASNPHPKAFTAGAGVQWTPVRVVNRTIKFLDNIQAGKGLPPHEVAWLASRRQPYTKLELTRPPCQDDVTRKLTEALKNGVSVLKVMWDCRFVLRFDLAAMPLDIAQLLAVGSSVLIRSSGRWILPVVAVDGTVVHSAISCPPEVQYPIILPQPIQYYQTSTPPITSTWITAEWIRPITSI